MHESSENPYRAAEASDGASEPRGLLCPTCGQRFRLTWSSYLSTARHRYACPACGSVGQAIETGGSAMAKLLAAGVAATAGGLLGYLVLGPNGVRWPAGVAGVAGVLIVGKRETERCTMVAVHPPGPQGTA